MDSRLFKGHLVNFHLLTILIRLMTLTFIGVDVLTLLPSSVPVAPSGLTCSFFCFLTTFILLVVGAFKSSVSLADALVDSCNAY